MNDFKKEFKYLRPLIQKAVNNTLESGSLILGPQVIKFEHDFAVYMGSKYAVGVANGLEALQIALMAVGVKPGDEVLTVANSAVATTLAITSIGALPVFIDIDDYYHMDINKIDEKISKKTKVILPVHLYGQTADMQAILKIASKYKLKVIEDACQAHGAEFNGKKAGSFGNAGAFSFYPTKNLGAYGDGGAIITNSKKLYETCLKLRNYGSTKRYYHSLRGLNSRLDEIQASILNTKLKKLPIFIKNRNKIAGIYLKELAGIKEILLPKVRKNSVHSYHLFAIQAEKRDLLMQYLNKHGVQSLIHYPLPIHKQECYKEFNSLKLDKTEVAARKILSLPIHPFMTTKEAYKVCSIIKKFYEIK